MRCWFGHTWVLHKEIWTGPSYVRSYICERCGKKTYTAGFSLKDL